MGAQIFLPHKGDGFMKNAILGRTEFVKRRDSPEKFYVAKRKKNEVEKEEKYLYETKINKINERINRVNITKIYENLFETRRSNPNISHIIKDESLLKRLSLQEEPTRSPNLNNNLKSAENIIQSPSISNINITNQNISISDENNMGFSNLTNIYNMTDLDVDNDMSNNNEIILKKEPSRKCFEEKLIIAAKLRNQYYSKLILKNVWEIEKNNHNSIFIFDWDDTLLTTHYITPTGLFNNNYVKQPKDYAMFNELDKNGYILLKLAISKGKTFIVTNAVSGWVETSAKLFLPEVSKLLKYLTIISARNSYEDKFPGNCRKWKIETFLQIQKCFKSNLITNLICIGDSIIEMEAAHIISKKFNNSRFKTIKFQEKPKPETVIKELNLVIKNFEMIFSSQKNLTINVEPKLKKG